MLARVSTLPCVGTAPTTVLDVAGGTGDIAFRIIDSMRRSWWKPATKPEVIVCDINPHMLGVGRERAISKGYLGECVPCVSFVVSQVTHVPCDTDPAVHLWMPGLWDCDVAGGSDAGDPKLSFLEGNAEKLPIASNSVDLYTIAFGIRNVTHVDAALREAFRVLKPGGRFMCLEFSKVENPIIAQFYDLVSACMRSHPPAMALCTAVLWECAFKYCPFYVQRCAVPQIVRFTLAMN